MPGRTSVDSILPFHFGSSRSFHDFGASLAESSFELYVIEFTVARRPK